MNSSLSKSQVEFTPHLTPLTNDVGVDSVDLVELLNHNLSEAVFRCNDSGEIIYVNDSFVKLFNLKNSAEAIGKNSADYYSNKSRLKLVRKHLKSDKAQFQGEMVFVSANGKDFHAFLSCRRVQRGRTYYIDGAIRDISQEKKTRLELKRRTEVQTILLGASSGFLDADLESIDSVIHSSLQKIGLFAKVDRVQVHEYDYDIGRCIVMYEWKSQDLFILLNETNENEGVPLEWIKDMVDLHQNGQHLLIKCVNDLSEGIIKEGLLNQGILGSLTVPMKCNGRCVGFISFDVMVSKLPDFDSNLISMLMLFANMVANISNRAKNHARLKRLIEQVTLKSKQHKDFSFITSHNIRASAANLVAISELMKKDFSVRYLDMLSTTVLKLNESVINVNNILNMENEKLLKRIPCDVKDAVRRVTQSLSIPILENDIEVVNEVGVGLFVKALPGYLDNIFLQLIKNAIRYGTCEGNKTIMIKGSRVEGMIQLSIVDFGNGFDSVRYGSQLFQVGARFHRDCSDGHGLGLYIVKQQVESLGGSIGIKSSEGKGTVVKILFLL